jgi:DNA-binding NarL/FixJ family response regulator
MVNVLLADDNNRVRKAIASILKSDPRVKLAGDASSFAGLLLIGRTSKLDVLVMDLSMPEREGWHLAVIAWLERPLNCA